MALRGRERTLRYRNRYGSSPSETVERLAAGTCCESEIAGCASRTKRVGAANRRALVPATTLYCRIVTKKSGYHSARFAAGIARQSDATGISGQVVRVPPDIAGGDYTLNLTSCGFGGAEPVRLGCSFGPRGSKPPPVWVTWFSHVMWCDGRLVGRGLRPSFM